MDYIKYFFSGLRTDAMTPGLTALTGTIRTAVLLLIGFLAQGLANQFSAGNFTLNFATIQGYVMPGVIILLNLVWKFTREAQNPALTIGQPMVHSVGQPPQTPGQGGGY